MIALRSSLHGNPPSAVIAAIGIWDPLVNAHVRFIERLREVAADGGSTAGAVLIHPHPASFGDRPEQWVQVFDVRGRLEAIREAGVETVLEIEFSAPDADRGTDEMLGVMSSHWNVAEIWLGATQTLGRGTAGSVATTDRLAALAGIGVRRFSGVDHVSHKIRALLATGRPAAAAELLGRAPCWHRFAHETRPQLGWAPGVYIADGWALGRRHSVRVDVIVQPTADGSTTTYTWPSPEIDVLRFVMGPGDDPEKIAREVTRGR